jgi:transcription antitermination factor NusA-like protein
VRTLNGENIDIVRWSESKDLFLGALFAPMVFRRVSFDEGSRHVLGVLGTDSPLLANKTAALRAKLFLQQTGWTLGFEIEG